MFEKLKNSKEARLAAAVALGVFGGLIAYRLFMWTHEWWADISSDNQTTVIQIAFGAAIVGVIYYGLRRLFNRDKYRQMTASEVASSGPRTSSRLRHALESMGIAFFLFTALLADITTVPFVIALCITTPWLIVRIRARMKRVKQARTRRAVEAERQRQIRLNRDALNRREQLDKFLKWMRLAKDAGLSYISPDSVMEDRQSQHVLESIRHMSTEELLDIVVRDDNNEWTEMARTLARQIVLYRAKSPDFIEALEHFKTTFVQSRRTSSTRELYRAAVSHVEAH